MKGTCTPNYSRFYVESQEELCPFYMLIPYDNAFCADSSQALQVKNQFLCFSYDKIRLKFCASFRFFLSIFIEKFQKKSVIWAMWELAQLFFQYILYFFAPMWKHETKK